MKRHYDLLELSREHHGALKLARDARLAVVSGDAERIAVMARRVNGIFPAELEPHFLAEEIGLLRALADSGERVLVEQTLAEHAELRDLAQRLREPEAAALLRFADLLTAHVRFEERTLFEAAQLRLPGYQIAPGA